MRIYFDGEEEPRVEVPVGLFFGIHYGQPYQLAHSEGAGKIIDLTLGLRQFDPVDAWYHCGSD